VVLLIEGEVRFVSDRCDGQMQRVQMESCEPLRLCLWGKRVIGWGTMLRLFPDEIWVFTHISRVKGSVWSVLLAGLSFLA